MCRLSLIRNMRGFLSTSHATIITNENLSNKPHLCMGLLYKLLDLLRPVDTRSIILGIFDPFYPSRDGIPLGTLGDCWAKLAFFKFYVFQTPLETGSLITSENDDLFLTRLSCTFCTVCDDVTTFMLFYGATHGTWVGVSLRYYSISGANQVSLR